MWGGGPATVDSCLEEGMGPCLAGSATPGAGLFPPCCCSHRCSGGEKADPASGSGVPCTPQSRQQPWCPFPRGGSPRSGVRAQLCFRSVRRCRGHARGAAAQLSPWFRGAPVPPGSPLRPPGRLPGPGLLLPSGLSRGLPSPSPCPWAGRCFTSLLDGLCADVAARGVCGGSRNLFLSWISPSCSRGGTGGWRTCSQSPPVAVPSPLLGEVRAGGGVAGDSRYL